MPLGKFVICMISLSVLYACNEGSRTVLPITMNDGTIDLGGSFIKDNGNKLILYNGNHSKLSKKIKAGDRTYEIENMTSQFETGKGYRVSSNGENYLLYKSKLPIVSIKVGNGTVVDDPKIPARMRLLETGKSPLDHIIGIELRGGASQGYPKKSYSVELWEDSDGGEKINDSLLGMRLDDDWVLDGLYNEPLRLRDFVSHDLWSKIARYPHSELVEIQVGIQRQYCELFVNEDYRGIYYLGEKVDRKQLSLKKLDDDGLRGELYEGRAWGDAVMFKKASEYDNSNIYWDGFEAKYPDDIGEFDWSNLHELVHFVANSTPAEFDEKISRMLDLRNAADYYIFVNLIFALDNLGKNLYTARYDIDNPYFFVGWDFDGSFGNFFTGRRMPISSNILKNNLFTRLTKNKNFIDEVKSRWNFLRGGELGTLKLQKKFQKAFEYLKNNGAYEREALNPSLQFNYSDEEIEFINSFIEQRTILLDSYFSDL